MGIIGVSAKLISIEKNKVNYDVSQEIQNILEEIEKLKDDKKTVEDLPEKVVPKEEPPTKEDPVTEKPKEDKAKNEETKKENIPDKKDDNKTIVKSKYISKEEAIEIAMKKVGPGGSLVEIKSDLDDNPPKYELEIILGNYEYELEIHAITGAIIDFDKDEID